MWISACLWETAWWIEKGVATWIEKGVSYLDVSQRESLWYTGNTSDGKSKYCNSSPPPSNHTIRNSQILTETQVKNMTDSLRIKSKFQNPSWWDTNNFARYQQLCIVFFCSVKVLSMGKDVWPHLIIIKEKT